MITDKYITFFQLVFYVIVNPTFPRSTLHILHVHICAFFHRKLNLVFLDLDRTLVKRHVKQHLHFLLAATSSYENYMNSF